MINISLNFLSLLILLPKAFTVLKRDTRHNSTQNSQIYALYQDVNPMFMLQFREAGERCKYYGPSVLCSTNPYQSRILNNMNVDLSHVDCQCNSRQQFPWAGNLKQIYPYQLTEQRLHHSSSGMHQVSACREMWLHPHLQFSHWLGTPYGKEKPLQKSTKGLLINKLKYHNLYLMNHKISI